MIFVILGILVLFASFIIALVTLAREQSRMNTDHLKAPNIGKVTSNTLAGKTILAKGTPKVVPQDDHSRKIREELEAKIAEETKKQEKTPQEVFQADQPPSETQRTEASETPLDSKRGADEVGSDYVPLPWNMPDNDGTHEDRKAETSQAAGGNLQGEFKIKPDKPGETT